MRARVVVNRSDPARWSTSLAWLAAAAIAAVLVAELYLGFTIRPSAFSSGLGFDYNLYMEAASRFLQGGSFYLPYQVAGPYDVVAREILYPPISLALLIPFTALPAVLWWAIPLGLTAAVAVWHRPSPWGWALILALLALPAPVPWALGSIVAGNPAMWAMALLAAGTRWDWPSVFVLLKPSLLPFAFFGARSRSWRLALVVLVLASLFLLPLDLEYISVLQNARGVGLFYSASNLPLMLIPLVAWLARRRIDDLPMPSVAASMPRSSAAQQEDSDQ